MGFFALGVSYATTVRLGDDEGSKGRSERQRRRIQKFSGNRRGIGAVVAAVYAKETAVRTVEPTDAGDPFARIEYFREIRTKRVPAGGRKAGSRCGIGTTEAADHGAIRNTPT